VQSLCLELEARAWATDAPDNLDIHATSAFALPGRRLDRFLFGHVIEQRPFRGSMVLHRPLNGTLENAGNVCFLGFGVVLGLRDSVVPHLDKAQNVPDECLLEV